MFSLNGPLKKSGSVGRWVSNETIFGMAYYSIILAITTISFLGKFNGNILSSSLFTRSIQHNFLYFVDFLSCSGAFQNKLQ